MLGGVSGAALKGIALFYICKLYMYLIYFLLFTLNFITSLQVVPLESPAGAYCIQVFL